jgi:hypothetical protein
VTALKAFQQRRFSHTYADLLQSPRYGAAARYFLEELYGPEDFSARDAQFARVAPTIARLFPSDLAETVAILSALHALSETLDSAMGEQLADATIAPADYVAAWQGVGREADRNRQIDLTLAVAAQLDRITRMPLLRNALRLMRGPARAAGLAELQHTLESGFDILQGDEGRRRVHRHHRRARAGPRRGVVRGRQARRGRHGGDAGSAGPPCRRTQATTELMASPPRGIHFR